MAKNLLGLSTNSHHVSSSQSSLDLSSSLAQAEQYSAGMLGEWLFTYHDGLSHFAPTLEAAIHANSNHPVGFVHRVMSSLCGTLAGCQIFSVR